MKQYLYKKIVRYIILLKEFEKKCNQTNIRKIE